MKRCRKCLRWLPLDDFYRHRRMADGFLSDCKQCKRSAVNANRTAKSSYYRRWDLERFKRPERKEQLADYQRVRRARRRAAALRRKGVLPDGR